MIKKITDMIVLMLIAVVFGYFIFGRFNIGYKKSVQATKDENIIYYSDYLKIEQKEELQFELKEMKKRINKIDNTVIFKTGDEGSGVYSLQKKLFNAGYNLSVDGIFGTETESIIKKMQGDNNIEQTGQYDKITEKCLNELKTVRNYINITSEESETDNSSIYDKIKNYLGSDINKIGLVYYDLKSGEKISINNNKVFTAASTYKVGMNIAAYDSALEGRLNLNDGIQYNSSYYEGGTGILQGQINTTLSSPVPVQKLLDLSIMYSDNIATNMISQKLGGAQNVRQTVCRITGISSINTVSNVITPEIEFRLLKRLYENRNNQYYNHLINIMKQTVFHDRIDKYIPHYITAHKIGNYGSYTNDVGIIFTDKPYILVMYTEGIGNADEKIAVVSKIIYNAQIKK